MLRSLGFGLGLETFAKFLRVSVSVSKNLVSEKSLGFGFGKFGLGRKVSVSEKFGLGKKSRCRFRKIWYRKKSIGIAFGQNFGIVIQWPQVQYFVQTSPDSTCNRIIGTIQIQCGDVKVALEKTQIMNERNALCHCH